MVPGKGSLHSCVLYVWGTDALCRLSSSYLKREVAEVVLANLHVSGF